METVLTALLMLANGSLLAFMIATFLCMCSLVRQFVYFVTFVSPISSLLCVLPPSLLLFYHSSSFSSSLPFPLFLSLQCGLLCEHRSAIPARLLHPPAAAQLLKLLVLCVDRTTQILQPVFTPGLANLRCVEVYIRIHTLRTNTGTYCTLH